MQVKANAFHQFRFESNLATPSASAFSIVTRLPTFVVSMLLTSCKSAMDSHGFRNVSNGYWSNMNAGKSQCIPSIQV
jgi:hypothetical protein